MGIHCAAAVVAGGIEAGRRPEVQLELEDVRVEIDLEAGGRIASLEVAGLQLLVPREENPRAWGCYPMAPWAGRVAFGRFEYCGREYELPITMAPHAIHGTTYLRSWIHEGEGRLSTGLGPDWPWRGRAVQEMRLDRDGLALRLEVHSAVQRFPASAGWHPWFRREIGRGGALELEFAGASMYERGQEGVPTGRLIPPSARPWDDCFTNLERAPVLTWPGALRLTIESPETHCVVYDEPEHAICVEPTTGPPNALTLEPRIVAPGEPLVARMRMAWERL